MRSIRNVALAAVVLALTVGCNKDKEKDSGGGPGSASLEGTYALESIEKGGQKVTAADLGKLGAKAEDLKVVIKGDKITMHMGDKEDSATIKVDSTKDPKQIDITAKKGDKTETEYGIYKLDGDVLTICTIENAEAKDRPKEFKSGGKIEILTLKKQK